MGEQNTHPVRRQVATSLAVALFIGAAALVWAGRVLDRSDVAGMDGGPLLLFSIIPIRPFAWGMALVLAGLGGLIMARASKT